MFISQMEAIELAEQMAAQLYRPTSRSEERHSSPFLCSTIRSNSSRGEDNEILHVVNFVDSMGYALVSTVKSRQPVLLVADHGRFNESEALSTPGFDIVYTSVLDYAISGRDSLTIGDIPEVPLHPEHRLNIQITDTIEYYDVTPDPLLKWGQRVPEGIFCANGISGCVPTAIATALAYLESPSSMKITYNPNIGTLQINWKDVKRHTLSGENITCCNSQRHELLGHICRQIGFQVCATYYEDGRGTDAQPSTVAPALRFYLPDYDVTPLVDYKVSNVCYSLKNKGITVLGAYRRTIGTNTITGGHCWVIDAYKYIHTHWQNYSVGPFDIGDPREVGILLEEDYFKEYWVHHNFGWNGYCNCYVYSPFPEILHIPNTNSEFFDILMTNVTPKASN